MFSNLLYAGLFFALLFGPEDDVHRATQLYIPEDRALHSNSLYK
jgi:hypothetical protein